MFSKHFEDLPLQNSLVLAFPLSGSTKVGVQLPLCCSFRCQVTAECCTVASKAIFQNDFQTPFSRLHALLWMVRQSEGGWQEPADRALLEVPGEQRSSREVSLGRYLF